MLEHLWVVLVKEGLVVDYNLFLFSSLSPFQQLVPLEKLEKSHIFFCLLTHEHKIYITEYTQHVLGERKRERKRERERNHFENTKSIVGSIYSIGYQTSEKLFFIIR